MFLKTVKCKIGFHAVLKMTIDIKIISDSFRPAIALNVSEGRENLWAKTKQAFKYVYENYKYEHC